MSLFQPVWLHCMVTNAPQVGITGVEATEVLSINESRSQSRCSRNPLGIVVLCLPMMRCV